MGYVSLFIHNMKQNKAQKSGFQESPLDIGQIGKAERKVLKLFQEGVF